MNLKSRIEVLEKETKIKDWLILECEIHPTTEQLQQMQEASNTGQMAILFGKQFSWAWTYGLKPKPWLAE